MNESGELQDLLTKIEVGFCREVAVFKTAAATAGCNFKLTSNKHKQGEMLECWKNAVQSNICRDKTSIINTQTKHHSVTYIKVREQASGLSWKRCKLYNCPFSRGSSIPRCARPVGTLPSSRARCAMAARCLCSATASRIPSKPSSALPATRTACSRV